MHVKSLAHSLDQVRVQLVLCMCWAKSAFVPWNHSQQGLDKLLVAIYMYIYSPLYLNYYTKQYSYSYSNQNLPIE